MVLILILLGLCYFLEKGRRRWVMKIIKMDKKIEKEQNRELEQFCRQIREYVQSGRIRECEQLIPQYMQVFCRQATIWSSTVLLRMFINETGKADHWILV